VPFDWFLLWPHPINALNMDENYQATESSEIENTDSVVVDAVPPYHEKLRLMKSIVLLKDMPERTIQALAEFLKPRRFATGAVVFKEGGRGMSMYFVASGRIRIYKRTASGSSRQLAIVGPGYFFGEMALVDEVPRSASAAAAEPCLLFELYSGDLERWVKDSAPQAIQFFAALSHVMARRLRNTSKELTLHFDLSDLLGNRQKPEREFLREALEHVLSYLEGGWSAAACLSSNGVATIVQPDTGRNDAFDGIDMNDALGGTPGDGGGAWINHDTFRVRLTSGGKTIGSLLFRSRSPVMPDERDELALTLAAVSSPITTGLEIIRLRAG
jgi:CRP/FNR family cyclic AMP-dependent transcriptional regulator